MLYRVGNLIQQKGNIGVSTNGFVKKNGEAVMGRGIAAQVKATHPKIALMFGTKIRNSQRVEPCVSIGQQVFWSIPVKPRTGTINCALDKIKDKVTEPVPGFWCKADIKIIETSLQQIEWWLDNKKIDEIKLPLLGCGNGELSWKKDIEQLALKYFKGDDRISFWSFNEENFYK